ncbi:TetR/AcrR family transcriptional regulator [Erwinia psidii]|uniref:TetR/AcrR family transcriptional regulator n=1 Tax=Erwinia psidii TaxID=69224 RepID=A0A3N6S6K9_9GAMM|nr:TetR/AcrR family transcriptional regulator [Erwinia psidii]MCX8959254.1 TetR/AcrR family transcriptional regulator [Erwinia psidii]MCX8962884.1 TetR/AcrR family transcriptional regulator [Erwinia psidii]MCX8966031.1 TetR/AcrR family transcriptional regulator [Erwinia psidii]RQM36680.1 TetR/AcrR family transcriptional regulator [Erwinia psidii]
MKVKTQARREAIIEAAAALFQEMGYERASMNELARRLGGSKATLYNYFPSKEELFSAVVRTYATQHLTDAASELNDISHRELPLKEKLQRFGERMLQMLVNDTSALAVYRMVVGEAGHTDIGTLFHDSGPRESIEKLSAVMLSAMDAGELRPGDANLRAMQFMALLTVECDSRVYQRHLQPVGTTRICEMTRCAVSMFFAGAGKPALQ